MTRRGGDLCHQPRDGCIVRPMSAARPPKSRHRTAPGLVALLIATSGCGTGGNPQPSGLDPPDMQLAPHYNVVVEVLEAGEGCVIGGLTPDGEQAEATPVQTGATVAWHQTGVSGDGLRWNLTGHVCEDEDAETGYRIRLYGGRNTRVGDGQDTVCGVNLALPDGHDGSRDTPNRCVDPRCSTVELVADGCGGWVADFEARLSYDLGCAEQPDCIMHMRWHATPDEVDDTCTPDLAAAAAWMQTCRTLP